MRWILPVALLLCGLGAFAQASQPWFTPVQGFVAPQAGEHPRLFFRKADVPQLRERAATPAGKAMIARLKVQLGGGEAMPTAFSDATTYDKPSSVPLPVGAYGLWHGMGFGMLYQLTGEQKYADLGKQCVQKTFDGVRDPDNRYAWLNPGVSCARGRCSPPWRWPMICATTAGTSRFA